MARGIAQLTQRIAALFRGNARRSSSRADVLGSVGVSPGIQQRVVQRVFLDKSMAHVRFLTPALGYAARLHVLRHPLSDAVVVKSR